MVQMTITSKIDHQILTNASPFFVFSPINGDLKRLIHRSGRQVCVSWRSFVTDSESEIGLRSPFMGEIGA